MKRLCLAIWAALSLLLGGLAAQALWEAPSLSNGCYLLLVGYYAFCFLQLIRAFFRPWGLLGPRRRTGYWLCLILLPLALLPLRVAYEIWLEGAYRSATGDSGLLSDGVLVWLQDLLGYVGPMLLLLAISAAIAISLLSLLKTQTTR